MSKVDIISGFLGAGKTTLIKKLIKESLGKEKVVLIENEFGEIGIDGSFLKEAGIEITEMNSGCICCSLVGDFSTALKKVMNDYHPDRIIIEPSGVGKLSDVMKAVEDIHDEELQINSLVTVIDAKKCKIYATNFGEFFNNQIEYASTIILSRSQDINHTQLHQVIDIIKEHNTSANIITTPWEELSGDTILKACENKESLRDSMMKDEDICPVCGHHHEEREHECGCGHHHEEHDHECGCGHHHEEHDHECGCGHHHHHADEVFTSLGKETIQTYTYEQLESILSQLSHVEKYGQVLRAKGILQTPEKKWIHFDFVPEEYEIRYGEADYTGRFCVIGKDLLEKEICNLFGVE